MSESSSDNELAEAPAANGGPKGGKQDEVKDAEKALAAWARCLLGDTVNAKQIELGLKRAAKDPEARKVFTLLAKQPAPGGGGKRAKKEKKEKSHMVRSAYQVFMTDAMHFLNQHAGEQGADGGAIKNISLMQVAGVWKRLPDDLKKEMNDRLNTVKDRINSQVKAGATEVDAHAELEKLNKEQKLKPYNYAALLQKYGSADDAAAHNGNNSTPAAKGNGKGNGKGAAAAAAAAPAAAAAGPSKGNGAGDAAAEAEKKRKHDGDDEARREKKKKKKDRERKEGKEAGNGNGDKDAKGDKEEKKKKKKHKHREEGDGAKA